MIITRTNDRRLRLSATDWVKNGDRWTITHGTVQRYTDGLHVAAEQLVGAQPVAELDQAEHYIPGLTTEPAWPTLRARDSRRPMEAATRPAYRPFHRLIRQRKV